MKRILVVGEASFLSTGFATYSLELLRRLHASGKYELMELASYSPPGDPRAAGLPWRHKSVLPASAEEEQVYRSNPLNEFGEWKFEEACLELHPDIVIDYRDWWMLEFQERSPFRPYFHWAIMPTCDAEPQDEQWLATYMNADAVFAYSDWGLDVLRRESRGRIRTITSASPGADLEAFVVKADRRAHKEAMGLPADCLIVGTVMRNQKRKLYPELFEAFARFLAEAPAEMARRSYLYLHTAWPDVGWDIPRLLRETGLGAKTLFSYACRSCGAAYPAFFQDARAHCKACGRPEATFPNSQAGVSRATLAEVLGLFDVYVQYANSEGFGIPLVEAAACGLVTMATDYSAMSDVVRKLCGIPIRVLFLLREVETHCRRAIPDPADFSSKLIAFLQQPEAVRQQMGWQARRAVEQHYTWDLCARRWMEHIDSVAVRPHEQTWLAPPRLHTPASTVPAGLSNEEFVRWGMFHVAGRPDLIGSYTALRMIRDLNWGMTFSYGMGGAYYNEASTLGVRQRYSPFYRDRALAVMADICARRNRWETLRAQRRRA